MLSKTFKRLTQSQRIIPLFASKPSATGGNVQSSVNNTKWQIWCQDGCPPADFWKRHTCITQMQWPPRMARWIVDAYNVNKISGSTEVVLNANTTVCCHPGYQGGEPVYD